MLYHNCNGVCKQTFMRTFAVMSLHLSKMNNPLLDNCSILWFNIHLHVMCFIASMFPLCNKLFIKLAIYKNTFCFYNKTLFNGCNTCRFDGNKLCSIYVTFLKLWFNFPFHRMYQFINGPKQGIFFKMRHELYSKSDRIWRHMQLNVSIIFLYKFTSSFLLLLISIYLIVIFKYKGFITPQIDQCPV